MGFLGHSTPITTDEIISAVKFIQEAARKKEEGEKPLETKSEAKAPATAKPAPVRQGLDEGTVSKSDGKSNDYATFVVLTVLAVFLVVFLLIFARYKLACHAISERYALYLSTLSYQKIRALRASEPGTTEEKVKRANEDLDKYLRFVRGDTGGGVRGVQRRNATYYKDSKLDGLPLKLGLALDLQTFTSVATNML